MTLADDYINKVLAVMPSNPRRSEIATELRGHIAERVEHGHPMDDVLKQLGDPTRLAESYLAAEPLVSATFWQRAAAKILDVLMILAFTTVLSMLAVRTAGIEFFFAFPMAVLTGSFLFAVCTVVSEWATGRTLGKRFMGLRVVRESGARIGGGQALVRQLPIFFQVYWVDILFALFTEKSQRAFEILSKTRVVRSSGDAR